MFASQELLPCSLERLWIPVREHGIEHLYAPLVKSLYLMDEEDLLAQLNNPKYSQMEHLSGIDFSDSLANMSQLKYVDGLCVNDNV